MIASPQYLTLWGSWLKQKVWGLTETKDIENLGKTFMDSPLGGGVDWLQIFLFCAHFTISSHNQMGKEEEEDRNIEQKGGALERCRRPYLWAYEENYSKSFQHFLQTYGMWWGWKSHVQGQVSKSLWEGEGEIFSISLFFAVSFFARSNCGIWGGGGPPSKASPVNVYGRGRGIIGQHASRGPLIMIQCILTSCTIKGKHSETLFCSFLLMLERKGSCRL